jgi:geranyl-CoA carboxylase alpha subunit
MLAKLIAFGETREAARTTLIRELEQVRVVGVRTNRSFLISLLKRDAFANGAVDITWLDREPPYEERNLDTACGKIAALELANGKGEGWRSTGSDRSIIILRERRDEKRLVVDGATIGSLRITDANRAADGSGQLRIADDTSSATAYVFRCGNTIHVHYLGRDALFEDITYAPAEPKGSGGANVIRAPMAGRIIKVAAEPGQAVAKNQVLVILEAMKMEHELKAAADGIIDTVTAKLGDQVALRQTLVTLKAP